MTDKTIPLCGFNRDPDKLIMNLPQALAWRAELKQQKRKLVITNGCFDILHRGHADYLMRARELGDAMLVLVNSDRSVQKLKGPERPVIDEYSRAYLLCALESVDAVVIFDTPRCDRYFSDFKPDIYVKGGDYTLDTIDKEERRALESVNAAIRFLPFVPGLSTTAIIGKLVSSQACFCNKIADHPDAGLSRI
ncbi:MAG: adenylyltransferase/cytidyltransferase family protein [Victivallales bacterium]|nr:adenylyltransferase/cytidyltransferase family protein [Victivallales bacterium]